MITTRLEKQVEKLEAELKEKKAQITREKRKERGGQLVALGIMVETAFRGLTEVVPIVRTGESGFLACLYPYQAAFKKPCS